METFNLDVFERATDLMATWLARFRSEDAEVTANDRLMAGHLAGALAANNLLVAALLPSPDTAEAVKALSDYTDGEIATEWHNRAMRRLGDPRTCVSVPATVQSPGHMSDTARAAKDLTLWAMHEYGITNGDALYRRIYDATTAAIGVTTNRRENK